MCTQNLVLAIVTWLERKEKHDPLYHYNLVVVAIKKCKLNRLQIAK
jgi:hypothetical protein